MNAPEATLRDYFAAQIIACLLSDEEQQGKSAKTYAEIAYRITDNMLEAMHDARQQKEAAQ